MHAARSAILSCLAVAASVIPHEAFAQASSDVQVLSAAFVVPEETVEPAPLVLKFQARISEARMPLAMAKVPVLQVKVLRSGQTACTESFQNVDIRDGILNLDIGRGMQCSAAASLPDALRAGAEVAFQVCLGADSDPRCLKPVDLGAVPFAMKSTYAHHAEEAHRANVAVQCNYAHRVTADPDLYVTQQVGKGYYEFHTPTRLDGLTADAQTNVGGFIQWTPMSSGDNKLHLCARDGNTGAVKRLATLLLHADETQVRGKLSVGGETTLAGALNVAGATRLAGSLNVDGTTTLGMANASSSPAALVVNGNAQFNAPLGQKVTFDSEVQFLKAVALPLGSIVAGNSVNSAAIINGSITAEDLATGSVTSAAIVNGAITADDLAASAITTGKLADGSVTTQKIVDGAVTSAKLADGGVTTSKIASGSISADKLASNSVTSSAIGNEAVASEDLARDLRLYGLVTFASSAQDTKGLALTGSGLDFGDDRWGGGGDDAKIVYAQGSTGGESSTLTIGIENDADDKIVLKQQGVERVTLGGGKVQLRGGVDFVKNATGDKVSFESGMLDLGSTLVASSEYVVGAGGQQSMTPVSRSFCALTGFINVGPNFGHECSILNANGTWWLTKDAGTLGICSARCLSW